MMTIASSPGYPHLVAAGLLCLLMVVPAWAGRHLFLDPSRLREQENATLHVNPPRQAEAVIRPDRPWETYDHALGAFVTVREEEGWLRMWYTCRDRGGRTFMVYAQSRDGIHWEKPSLGVFDYEGSRDNNIVLEHFWEGTPFLDPNAASPAEKYVYLGHAGDKGFYRFTSPDGLKWKQDERPLLPFRVDTHVVTFWDTQLSRYVLYLRGWDVPGAWDERLRKVVRLTLETLAVPAAVVPSGKGDNPTRDDDLPRVVDEIPTVLTTDEHDPPNTDVYNSAMQPYPVDPRWYVGFPSFFRRENIVVGRLEVQFVGSRDGIEWHRYDHAPYTAPGLAGSDRASRTYMGVGLVVRGDEIWQYGVGKGMPHGPQMSKQSELDGTVYRYVQRIDGFVSLEFALDGGRALTEPVKVEGDRLRLNVDTGALGDLRVALLGVDGKPLSGYTLDDCDRIETNSVRATVTWRGRGDLSALVGREVQLQFAGTRAKLYSFRFEPSP